MPGPIKGSKELTMSSRKGIFCLLFMGCSNGQINHGQIVRVATAFNVNRATVKRVWAQTLSNMEAHLLGEMVEEMTTMELLHLLFIRKLNLSQFPDHVFNPNKKGVVGRKRVIDREAIVAATMEIPHNKRGTLRDHAAACNISHVSSWRMVNKEKIFNVVSSVIKPTLTAANEYERFQWCMSWVDMRSFFRKCMDQEDSLQFADMLDHVHIDEKWFKKTKVNRKVIMAANEAKPKRTCKHKNHIEQIMFLNAQARPRYDPHRKYYWDGKIALIPIGDYIVAKKNSVNYKKGDRKWENKTVDTDTYLDLMETILRNIAEKWPRGQWSDPKFQVTLIHDGAPAHKSKEFKEGWHLLLCQLWVEGILPSPDKILIITQPPNSPDMNVNDLGLFNAIQSRYWREAPRSSLDIIDCVRKAWRQFPAKRINHLFLTLQGVMNLCMEHYGSNDFALPHLSKARLQKAGDLPLVLEVTPQYWPLFNAMDDPDYTDMDANWEFHDDDLPLAAKISRKEFAELLSHAGTMAWIDKIAEE